MGWKPGTYITKQDTPKHDLVKSSGVGFNLWDIIAAIIGQLNRQGLFEIWSGISAMCALQPLFKYCCFCNPFIHKLDHLFTNQWSDKLDANWSGKHDEEDYRIMGLALKSLIAYATLDDAYRRVIDAWPFIGYYPYPTKNNTTKTVNGMQYSGTHDLGLFANRFTLITTTCHTSMLSDNVCRSNKAKYGLVSVYLQLWNPYHFCVGEVEVNVRKDHRVEHPMWLICDT